MLGCYRTREYILTKSSSSILVFDFRIRLFLLLIIQRGDMIVKRRLWCHGTNKKKIKKNSFHRVSFTTYNEASFEQILNKRLNRFETKVVGRSSPFLNHSKSYIQTKLQD